jgi:hypothetical protein
MKESRRWQLQVTASFILSVIVFILAVAYRGPIEPHTYMERVVASIVILVGIGSGVVMTVTGVLVIGFILLMIAD